MQPLIEDRLMLQRRMHLALETLRDQAEVDASQTAAMGFCFGGLSVLDLARTGADVKGVASFHGLFNQPGNTADNQISAKVLAMHGWNDPMATPEQVVDFAAEMTGMGADWQLHAFGNTSHAFTNPEANDPEMGLMYQADADRRSWDLLRGFLAELFA
jgi:dienelactone hydrolase